MFLKRTQIKYHGKKEGYIGKKEDERRGRKKLPPGTAKVGIKVYLRGNLVDWYLELGKSDNLTQALENIAQQLGYKEATDNQKEGTADRRPRRTNQTSSICATELNQTI